MKFKIIGFTKFQDGSDKDCIAVTEFGKRIIVDPFVGCAWEYENRVALLNTWFEINHVHWFNNNEFGILLPAQNDMTVIQEPKPKTFLQSMIRKLYN